MSASPPPPAGSRRKRSCPVERQHAGQKTGKKTRKKTGKKLRKNREKCDHQSQEKAAKSWNVTTQRRGKFQKTLGKEGGKNPATFCPPNGTHKTGAHGTVRTLFNNLGALEENFSTLPQNFPEKVRKKSARSPKTSRESLHHFPGKVCILPAAPAPAGSAQAG